MKYRASKSPFQNNGVDFFSKVFQNRLHRTPNEYIEEKIKTGSKIDDIRYLFNVVAAEISLQNSCKYFDFDYFYNRSNKQIKTPQSNFHKSATRPQNAGAKWSAEDEQLLVKMYNNGATKREMCDRFKRTETGLAARLVHLGIIKDRDVFRNRK